jgi:predicted MFS family arabinose efflux permease
MSYSKHTPWFMWIIASTFYAYQYILRVMPNIFLPDIMEKFQIDAADFGQFSGVYYLGYSLMHLPIGLMLDRYGPRKVITGCILLTVVGLLPIIFADSWIYPVMGRVMIGMGSSAAILGTFKIIRMTFKEERFTRMLSFSVTIGLLGAIYGGAPVSYMCDHLGYQIVIVTFIVLGLLLALAAYWVIPETRTENPAPILSTVKAVLTNRKVMGLCFFTGLMVGPLEGFADVWGAAFFKQVYGFEQGIANSLPSIIFMGMCFGGPLLSIMAEKTGNYLGFIMGAGFVMLLVFLALIAGVLTINSITISFILVGICCSYQIIAIYKASTYVSESVAGLTNAVANMIIMSFGYAFHAVIGFVVNLYGGIEKAQPLIYGIGIIPAALAVGTIGFSVLFYQERSSIKKQSRGV